jgi:hypothetical protein
MAIVDQFGSFRRVPTGRVKAASPANELVAVIVRGFPSSSTKKVKRLKLPKEFTDTV